MSWWFRSAARHHGAGPERIVNVVIGRAQLVGMRARFAFRPSADVDGNSTPDRGQRQRDARTLVSRPEAPIRPRDLQLLGI
jgi:hypothetical protein